MDLWREVDHRQCRICLLIRMVWCWLSRLGQEHLYWWCHWYSWLLMLIDQIQHVPLDLDCNYGRLQEMFVANIPSRRLPSVHRLHTPACFRTSIHLSICLTICSFNLYVFYFFLCFFCNVYIWYVCVRVFCLHYKTHVMVVFNAKKGVPTPPLVLEPPVRSDASPVSL